MHLMVTPNERKQLFYMRLSLPQGRQQLNAKSTRVKPLSLQLLSMHLQMPIESACFERNSLSVGVDYQKDRDTADNTLGALVEFKHGNISRVIEINELS